MDHLSDPINQYSTPTPRPKRRSVPYPASPRMSDSPFKPTSSLRHRRQSSTVMSAGLMMSPSSYSGEAEWCGNGDVEAASRSLGNIMGRQDGKGVGSLGDTDDDGLGRIAQAMTLLSLHPTHNSGGGALQFSPSTPASSTGLAPWPSPEELLKESLRQSLSALHALGRIKSLVENLPPTGEEEEEFRKGEGEIAQIMGYYDRAVGEMRAAGEVLTWAQQYLSEEKEAVRERLLKG